MSKTYGYVRVSSIDQNEERQMEAMLALGIAKSNIIVDKKSFGRQGNLCLLFWRHFPERE